jgi:hypothetical protein
MEEEHWLVGWREIGKYLGRSAKTARRWAKAGLPFFKDLGGRPISKPSLIDEFIVDLNRCNYDDKKWRDEGIETALSYEDYREKQKKEFNEKLLEAQKRPRSMF